MKTSDFDYDLPLEFIAQSPVEPRDMARLLVMDRKTQKIRHSRFRELGLFLHAGDLIVLNETRVIPARLFACKEPTGGRIEVLLLRKMEPCIWDTLVGGKGLGVGRFINIEDGPRAEVLQVLDGGRRLIRFTEPIEPHFEKAGHVPLPPYIHTPLEDPERYQTVYAHQPGSAAAPTAGLHFTPQLIERLKKQGIRFVTITLHIGMDTFVPVSEENPEEHKMHSEWCQLDVTAAKIINKTKQEGGRIIAVGTTSVRILESTNRRTKSGEIVSVYEGTTDLFILPGYRFQVVDALITNFHLPRSTLIMMVCAFAGRELILETYRTAMQEGYRFYSFGDAMLIL